MKRILQKAGGWIKCSELSICKKKMGFTIIESLVYIFLTTMILVQGISLFISLYKSYIDAAKLTITYNNYQNFFINLDNIISEGGLEQIKIDNNVITFSKKDMHGHINKIIKSYEGRIIIKYTRSEVTQTINYMLKDIDNLEVHKKGKLIYFIIHDKDGREFIRCI